jgi:NADPH2:quinone reductase
MMKAVVCREYGAIEQLKLEDAAPPPCPPDCVRIDVAMASVNPPDVLMAQGRYQVKPPLPFVLGVEGAGTVSEIGTAVTGLRVGDRVMTYAGQGCFAEQAVIDAGLAIPIPDGMEYGVAAGFVLAYSTVYHGLVDCGQLARGEVLVVLGAAGGLGLAAVDLGKALGATVIAVASTPEKRALCLAGGADHAIKGDPADLRDEVKRLTAGRGADVVFDIVGGPVTESALRSIAPYGRLLIAGYASGEIPMIKANLVLLKQARVIGVSYRLLAQSDPAAARRNMRSLLDLWRQGLLRPPLATAFPASRFVEALRLVADRKVLGKTAISFRA